MPLNAMNEPNSVPVPGSGVKYYIMKSSPTA